MIFLKLIRPFNCIFVFLSVLFGAFIHARQANLTIIFFAAFSAALIAAAGYVINDYFDLPIDKINKPERPLPAGKIKPAIAYLYAVMLFTLGIALSFFTQNLYCAAIAVLNSLALFFYARQFKVTPFFGNLIVAYAAASTFIYGGLSNSNINNSFMIAIFAFLFTLIRELIKDCEDIDGDQKLKARTLAIILGKKRTISIAIIPAIMIIILIYYLALYNHISTIVLLLMNVLVIIPLTIFFISMFKNNTKKNLSEISKFMKFDMLIVLITLWFGK